MQNETQTSPEIQQNAVQMQLPADLLTQLEEVKAQTQILTRGNENWLTQQINGGYDTYGHDMSEFTGDLEALEKSGLEPFNFRVDSSNWEMKNVQHTLCLDDDVQVRVNPEMDIFEYVSGVPAKLIGEQIFTWDAAIRETQKLGKKLPTKEHWEKICLVYGQDGKIFSKELGLIPAVFQWDIDTHESVLDFGYYWSCSFINGKLFNHVYNIEFSDNSIFSNHTSFESAIYCVRCLKTY